MLLCYMQTHYQMHRYQNTEKKSAYNTIYFTHYDQQVYTNIGMMKPDSNKMIKNESEATILFNFLQFLQHKRVDEIFNVPRGKIDILEEHRVKFFLALSGANKDKIAEPLRKKGWKEFPFFVIDPYDRSSFPTVESGLVDGDQRLAVF